MTPEKIGRYEIRGEIGRGGMATVYHAYDPHFERDVAVKTLPRKVLDDATFLSRFEKEAKTIAAPGLPGIVPIYDFGEADGRPYLVMQYMPGGSLAVRLYKGALPLAEAVRIVEGVAPALDYIHKAGLLHRNIKPSNILFDRLDTPCLSDFGLAGTPAYMAPEVSNPGGFSPLGDVYALGVTFLQMVTGKKPCELATPVGAAANAHLPPAVQAVIQRVMAEAPADRYPPAGEFAAELKAAMPPRRVSLFAPSARAGLPLLRGPVLPSLMLTLLGWVFGFSIGLRIGEWIGGDVGLFIGMAISGVLIAFGLRRLSLMGVTYILEQEQAFIIALGLAVGWSIGLAIPYIISETVGAFTAVLIGLLAGGMIGGAVMYWQLERARRAAETQ